MKKFALNKENIRSIPFNKYVKDFKFIVNEQEYYTNRIIADILSPSIRNLHYTDESINEFNIKTKESHIKIESDNRVDYFNDFLQLLTYDQINLDENHKNFFSEFFLHLGNFDEYFRVNTEYFKEITSDNAIDYLLDLEHFQLKTANQFSIKSTNSNNIFSCNVNKKLIDFISKNFEKINKKRIKDLDFDTIEQIISNDTIQLFDEDSLLLFLLDLYESDTKYSPLFEYVIFENLGSKSLYKFIDTFNIEYMNNSIWKSISSSLLKAKIPNGNQNLTHNYIERPLNSSKAIQFRKNLTEFYYNKGKDFNGILRYLTNLSKGNIHDNGTVDISSNSIVLSIYHPKNLVDFDNDNFYFSKDINNSFVRFDFKNRKVKLTSYSIKSHNDGQNCGHLRNWVIEGSNDGNVWGILDQQKNCSLLNGSNLVVNFPIKTNNDDAFYRLIRIRSTGNSWYKYGNHNQIYFSLIEFFGIIDDLK